MAKEHNRFGLRLPPDLQARLQREAKINGRSLNSEIVDRLTKSLSGKAHTGAAAGTTPALSDTSRAMLTIFDRLPPEKQLALISLFR